MSSWDLSTKISQVHSLGFAGRSPIGRADDHSTESRCSLPPLLDEDYLILSTIHSAKGQEWKNVFVLNGVDGCIPSDLGVGERNELEEERRLLYVAMTRAKAALHLITPQRFFAHGQASRGDRHVYASRTRFIPDHIPDRFQQTSWPPPSAITARVGRSLRCVWI